MDEQHADQGYRPFFKTMAGMTWKERFSYFIYYYGKFALIAILVLVMLGDLLWETLRPKPEVVCAGIVMNVQISEELEDVLIDDLMAHYGITDPEKQEVTLQPMHFTEVDFQVISSLETKLSVGTYDYALLNPTAMKLMAPRGVFPDLNLLLPKEKLEPWADRFIYGNTEDGEKYPIGINLTDTAVDKECTYNGDSLYLAFPATQETAHRIPALFDYIVENLLTEAN